MSRIATFGTSRRRSFTSFVTSDRLTSGPVVTLLTNDEGRRVGSGLPSVVQTTSTFPNCRLILTTTPNVSPRCCTGFMGKARLTIVFSQACHLLRRTSITLIASNATALRATLFHIPRIIYCCAPINGLISFLQERVLGIGFVSLIGLVTKHRIIERLITSAVAMRGVQTRLRHLLFQRSCHHGVLSNCRRVTQLLKPTKTPQRTTHRVIGLLGG